VDEKGPDTLSLWTTGTDRRDSRAAVVGTVTTED